MCICFLTAKLCLLFAFTPHDMTGFAAWLLGCGKEWPDEFMQSGEINVLVGFGRREKASPVNDGYSRWMGGQSTVCER